MKNLDKLFVAVVNMDICGKVICVHSQGCAAVGCRGIKINKFGAPEVNKQECSKCKDQACVEACSKGAISLFLVNTEINETETV